MTAGENEIILAHGGGGELTRKLLESHILSRLANDLLNPLTDSAVFSVGKETLCMSTDAFVVQPLEFPGGDIGRLAVCGTVNDLAVMGARPLLLSLALVLEEGLPLETLDKVLESIRQAADEAQVHVATGDTKVIERQGGRYGMTITTAGVGRLFENVKVDAARIRPGDAIIINGRIAEHGLAVMSAREGLAFQTSLLSDVAPLTGLIETLCSGELDIRFMRDPTRAGLAGLLVDLAESTGLGIEVREEAIPVSPVARHTAELLGLDPLTVANEGKCVIVVPAEQAEKLLQTCRRHPLGRYAAHVGRFVEGGPARVELLTSAGGRRLIQRPYGEELPRIC